jgi:hypothetical protein
LPRFAPTVELIDEFTLLQFVDEAQLDEILSLGFHRFGGLNEA